MSDELQNPFEHPREGPLDWGSVDTIQEYILPDGQIIVTRLRTFSATIEDALTCGRVAFRHLLTQAGVDWRNGGSLPEG